MIRKTVFTFALPLTIGLAVATMATAQAQPSHSTWKDILDHKNPRLVVVMSFDQFRYDLLTRNSNHMLPATDPATGKHGGYRWLTDNGATLADAHYHHLPLHTGPGHATIMTGAAPRYSGIIGNSWYTTAGISMNCVGDPASKPLGVPQSRASRGSSSPRNLLAETVGDALRMANNRQSKVYGIAIKDRGSILPSGHSANGAVWFDSTYGRWVSSDWYADGLPEFAQHFNENRLAEKWFGKQWDYLLDKSVYEISMPEDSPGVRGGGGLPSTFPKPLSEPGSKPDKDYFGKLIFTPFGNEMVIDTAKLAIEHQELGKDEITDILTLSFSTTDLIGHAWGSHSREAQDNMLRTDRYVADLINYLDENIEGGLENVLIVVTADHGVAPLPEWSREFNLEAARVPDRVVETAEEVLATAFPDKQTTGIVLFSDPHVVFRQHEFIERGIDMEKATDLIAEALRKLPEVQAAYTRDQIQSGRLPHTRLAQFATNGHNPDRCGEIIVISNPFHFNSRGTAGTTHGSGYNYDTHVPIIFAGKTIKPGVYTDRADIRDIAPTLSFLLGITAPANSEGRILSEILK